MKQAAVAGSASSSFNTSFTSTVSDVPHSTSLSYDTALKVGATVGQSGASIPVHDAEIEISLVNEPDSEYEVCGGMESLADVQLGSVDIPVDHMPSCVPTKEELEVADRKETILEVRAVLIKRNLMLQLENKCHNMDNFFYIKDVI